jgi:hypothetical protein
MKTHKVIFLASLLLPLSVIFAAPYDMILTGDPVLEDLRYLSLESGNSILSFTAPLAPHEIEKFLDRIDASLLSPQAREAYNRITDRLKKEANLSLSWDDFSVFLNVNAALEARTRFNTDIDWYPVYPKIPAFLSLPARFFFADTLQLYFEPCISINPEDYSYRNNGNFSTNMYLLGYNSKMDGNFPLRAFVAAGGSWWNFQLGRDRLAFGTGMSGNLAIADNPAFYEYMRLSFFAKYFKYSLLVNHTPLRITGGFFTDPDPSDPAIMMSTQRYFYLHRIDFNLFDVLSVGLMEGLMVGNSALEIRYLNPFMLYHNFFSSYQYDYWDKSVMGQSGGHMNGSFFSVEVNWNIIKSLAAYGQFVMNEFATAGELAQTNDQPPNGLGFMGGLQYSHSFDTWSSLFFLECIYTYPYLYMNSTPFASIIHMRSVSDSSRSSLYYYFGYPRDTFAVAAGARFFDGDKLIINGNFSWISSGKHGGHPIVWDWERGLDAFNETAPSGTPENKFIVSVEAQWKPLPYLAFNGSLTGILSKNHNNTSGSDAAGGQASLSVSFFY